MFLPWWAIMLGLSFVAVLVASWASARHSDSCEWCACSECEAFHEADHVSERPEV
jgi:hypothetical protein